MPVMVELLFPNNAHANQLKPNQDRYVLFITISSRDVASYSTN